MRIKTVFILIWALALTFTQAASAGKSKKPETKASAHQSESTEAPVSDTPSDAATAPAAKADKPAAEGTADRLLSDAWYTVMINKVVRYEYYNERIELKKGKVFFQSRVWKREE